jgi:methyl-accepting chemotaxis protein
MASRPPLDPLDVLRSARDSVRRLQELASKMSVPVEQRRALTDGLSRMIMPGEQIQAMIDLADAFGPAHTQIAEIRDTLQEQRDQVEQMLTDLDRLEEKVARLAAASEQISAMQEPFRLLLRRFETHAEEEPDGDDEAPPGS